MIFRKVESYEKLSQLAALEIKKKIQKGNSVNLGLPTGGTPLGMYKELVNDPHIDWWNVTTFNLDEYIGIDPNHAESYENFMNRNLFNHIDIDRFNVWFPSLENKNGYDSIIENNGGLDLTILGIGRNGHIAFNEPGSPFNSTTRVVDLDKETIEDNSRFFNSIEEVPIQAVTMGLETIMKSDEILLIAQGKKKLEIIKEAMFGDITEDIPASILQEHENLTILYCE
jgi:glucosamine-6-phosphate deaminase